MTPEGTEKFRSWTAWLAILWATSALLLSVWGQVSSPRTVEPPIHTTSVQIALSSSNWLKTLKSCRSPPSLSVSPGAFWQEQGSELC